MKKYLSFPFAEEAPPATEETQKQNADAPEYHFDGFTVVVNEKVTLTPIKWHKKKKHG